MSLESSLPWAMGFLAFAMLLVFWGLRKGPTLSDRILALDLMSTLILALLCVYSLMSGKKVFLDVAMIFAVISFFSTAIYARILDKEGGE